MKQFFYFSTALLLMAFMNGCVEINEDYDLSKISNEEITIGNEFIAPIAKVTTSIADMNLGDFEDIIPHESVMQKADASTVVSFQQNYAIEGAIDQSIIDMLTAQGELYLLVDIENYTHILFEGYAHFLDAEGNVVCNPLGEIQIAEGSNTTPSTARIEVEITADDLKAIGSAASIDVYYKTNITDYTPSEDDVVVLTFKTKKIGGISLSF